MEARRNRQRRKQKEKNLISSHNYEKIIVKRGSGVGGAAKEMDERKTDENRKINPANSTGN